MQTTLLEPRVQKWGTVLEGPPDSAAEWLEADGLGGFASGTVGGIRTRRYHALMLVATTPPTGRYVLVNGFDAWVEREGQRFAITSQRYQPDVRHPDGEDRLASFRRDPWPSWTYVLNGHTRIEHELFAVAGSSRVVLRWRLAAHANGGARLIVRPFLSGRDYHSLHHENAGFRFDAEVDGARVAWKPYAGVPGAVALTNGSYIHAPDWYRSFLYSEERDRGLDCVEDLASPGTFEWDLTREEAVLLLQTDDLALQPPKDGAAVLDEARRLRATEEARRSRFPTELHRSADAYLVKRGSGRTVVAGYPWFTDWGRDTFIALRGLCIASGRLREAGDILLEWASTVSEGMLPNRFPDQGGEPEFNSVDASLWYVIAVADFLSAATAAGHTVTPSERGALESAIQAILTGYSQGTRYGIRADRDGLLAAGVPGVQLTWMDAKVGDWVVTPRIGKPVEVQALWLNALNIGASFSTRWRSLLEEARRSFGERFWNTDGGFLHDVVDADHQPGAVDPTFRPNQIFAVGGLPLALLDGDRARQVVDAVEAQLLTPLGLRSLAPGESGYAARYEGGVLARDGAYHQGTVWPFLMGAFVEAWVRVRGGGDTVKDEARRRFLDPLLAHLGAAGLGHISEIADGETPFRPRGCPFQAWSVGEALRLDQVVLRHGAGTATGRDSGSVVR